MSPLLGLVLCFYFGYNNIGSPKNIFVFLLLLIYLIKTFNLKHLAFNIALEPGMTGENLLKPEVYFLYFRFFPVSLGSEKI